MNKHKGHLLLLDHHKKGNLPINKTKRMVLFSCEALQRAENLKYYTRIRMNPLE